MPGQLPGYARAWLRLWLQLFNQSFKVKIMRLVIYGLWGGYTHTYVLWQHESTVLSFLQVYAGFKTSMFMLPVVFW